MPGPGCIYMYVYMHVHVWKYPEGSKFIGILLFKKYIPSYETKLLNRSLN